MNRKALSDAIKLFRIHDVFIIESKSWIRDNAIADSLPSLSIQLRHAIQAPILYRTTTDEGKEHFVMRRFVETGIRFIESAEDGTVENLEEPTVFAEVTARFASEYLVRSSEEPPDELLNAFEPNVVFHVWPYWRELIQSSLMRMRMAPVAIPMFSLNLPVRRSPKKAAQAEISDSLQQPRQIKSEI